MNKKYLKVALIGAIVAVSTAMFFACSDDDNDVTVAVTGISLNKTTLTLTAGDTATLTATVLPANATDKAVTWESNVPATATVDANGKVTAVAVGSATITAKAGNQTATCTVTITAPDESATFTVTVENGNSYNSRIDSVALLVYNYYDDEGGFELVVAAGTYANGGFTVNLPATLSPSHLVEAVDGESEGVTVSDKKARIAFGEFEIYAYKNSNVVGAFYCAIDGREDVLELYYADRDVSITGTELEEYEGSTYIYNYNLYLKKGWNIVYWGWSASNNTETYEDTTTIPGGLKWYFEEF
ncbi:hypothetical protein FACS1894199_10480 [Bacteroidia bacterium]|nr:hypothetical protein FACS1894199_10480 [Bacteroidia bacterium]